MVSVTEQLQRTVACALNTQLDPEEGLGGGRLEQIQDLRREAIGARAHRQADDSRVGERLPI